MHDPNKIEPRADQSQLKHIFHKRRIDIVRLSFHLLGYILLQNNI